MSFRRQHQEFQEAVSDWLLQNEHTIRSSRFRRSRQRRGWQPDFPLDRSLGIVYTCMLFGLWCNGGAALPQPLVAYRMITIGAADMNTFVSESVSYTFERGAANAGGIGEPILPAGFIWRKKEYRIQSVLEAWKESGPCKSGSSERYLRKHWYRIRTTDGTEMEIYFERQARSPKQRKKRWWLFSVSDDKKVAATKCREVRQKPIRHLT